MFSALRQMRQRKKIKQNQKYPKLRISTPSVKYNLLIYSTIYLFLFFSYYIWEPMIWINTYITMDQRSYFHLAMTAKVDKENQCNIYYSEFPPHISRFGNKHYYSGKILRGLLIQDERTRISQHKTIQNIGLILQNAKRNNTNISILLL